MSFQIALSGLNAAVSDLNVTANNIANVGTSGFKQSRAEFADIFPISAYGTAAAATGAGVYTARVAQQFDQGNITATGNSLDLSISGDGFFTVSDGGALAYTRNGAFSTDTSGNVVTATGARLQVFPPLSNGKFDTANLSDLQLSTSTNPPKATAAISADFNLPANATQAATTTFDASDATSYNQSTAVTVYDSLGVAHQASLYFVKNATANSWDVHTQIDGTDAGTATLTYDSAGALTAPAGGNLAMAFTSSNGSADLAITLNMADSTQYGNAFSSTSTQDGYATGQLTTISIDSEGIVSARYTNGQATPLGQVALTRFANNQGLQQLGSNTWTATYASGSAQVGSAGSPGFGAVQSGSLEDSNVDVTEQLVHMITAQRNYQANAKMISTADEVSQTIINLR